MTTLYKAVRPDGTDFYTGTVQWAPSKMKARKGRVVKHPTATRAVPGDFSTFLSVSTDPTRLPGSEWPMRLLVVEPVGELVEVGEFKRGGVAFRVLEEVDPAIRFGPMGEHVAALVERAGRLTDDEVTEWVAARGAARNAARGAARNAARGAARDAAWDAVRGAARNAARGAARNAAWDAAWALVTRDLIGSHGYTQAHYDTLTGPWREVIGPIHPDDPKVVRS